jgi:hypothetical protein
MDQDKLINILEKLHFLHLRKKYTSKEHKIIFWGFEDYPNTG